MRNWSKPFAIVAISCLGILVYSNTFHCSFHLDDPVFIIFNSAIRNIQDLLNIWKFYPCRFFTFFSIAVNYHFHQLNVCGYHLFNLAVHLGSAILVWWLTLLTFSTPVMKQEKIVQHAKVISLFAGLIFVSHPAQTEAVTYIWQRASSLATLFYLASLCLYVKSRLHQNKNPIYYIASLIMAVIAMFTKEITVTLPLMILFYEVTFLNNKRSLNWRQILPFLLTIIVIPLTTLLTHSEKVEYVHGSVVLPGGNSSMQYIFTQFRVMVTYIRLIFLPLNQNIDYDYHISKSIFELPTLCSFLFLIVILFCTQRLFSKYRLISFSIVWFFLTSLPESIPFPIKDVISEHRLYLPLVGYSIFLVSGMYYGIGLLCRHSEQSEESKGILRSFTSLGITMVIITMVVACYSILTYQRNKVWRDDFSLWEDTVNKSPHKARPYLSRGMYYNGQAQYTKAMFDFNKAVEIDPEYAEARISRGMEYYNHAEYTKALSDFNKAIEIDPGSAVAYFDRGLIYDEQNNISQALSDYTKAIEIKPNTTFSYENRGIIYANQGEYSLAYSDLNKAIEINPDNADIYKNRLEVYKALIHKIGD